MTDYSALRRLAHEASETEMGWLDRDWLSGIMADDWAEYVAAVDPEVVIGLIDENDRLSGECEGCPMAIAEELRIERDQLKAENEALRKAANELRRFSACEDVHHDKPDWHEYGEPCKVLARIDAVLGGGGKPGD